MGTFLQILGAFFLFIILFVVFSVIFGKFLVKKKLQQMVDQVQKTANGRVYEHEDVSRSNRNDYSSDDVIDIEVSSNNSNDDTSNQA